MTTNISIEMKSPRKVYDIEKKGGKKTEQETCKYEIYLYLW